MSKFYNALKKAEAQKGPSSIKSSSKTVFEVASENTAGTKPDPALPAGDKHTERTILANTGSNNEIDHRLISLLAPSSQEAECFKMLRSKLLIMARSKPLRTIMVTSAMPSDGKSLVSANLAATLAMGTDDYALLVDCDLRAPSQHRLFGIDMRIGLREFLEKETSARGTLLAPYLVKTPLEKLTLLPGGRPSSRAAELLGSNRMRLLVEELKHRHDDRYIVFDTPPVQHIAETALLSRMVDGVLLVVRYGKTEKQMILDTIESIGRDNILGIVFNASKESSPGYYYYSRYYQQT